LHSFGSDTAIDFETLGMNSLHQIRQNVTRLQRYSQRAKDKIWAGKHDDIIGAMADVAEANEITHRLYSQLETLIKAKQ
jgi:hypothetical protein